ncbi:Tim10/DDP family zinc finger-domain-containing protein [Sparassis latifolia]|uniref:Mitochondrial import inner membrane translocase subunit n=1 Tax=Sparassis crispa TaxID=139825 RepID=A0A401H261_9APHY|nr:Mitochondrial import inner membrane translocase subunit TIM13 [Sparassis crispa]GBE88450.1 Mitochondrial import inner membrane translocase subunit TIM13 [Sparassis crispa]
MSGIFGSVGSSSLSSPSSSDMAARKEAMMSSIRSEIALANAQELMNKTNEKCFAKCITKPSTSLSGSEETCLSNCLNRYMEAFNIVSKTYVSRLSRERLDHP